jgi:hypothetical protein
MTTKVTGSVLADTAVTPGTYGGTQTLKAFTVDAQGRITYAANITSGVITAGTRGQGADIIVPTIQYNALGQIVAATNTTIRTATTSVTGVVQLADSVSNTSTTAAATASAVKAAFDAAAANAATVLTSSQNASNLSSGTVPAARLSGSYTGITGVGTLAAGSVPSSLVSGLASSATTDTTSATNITSGTLPAARLSGSYTGITGVGTLAAGSIPTSLITGLASSATTNALNASNISSGTLSIDRFPTIGRPVGQNAQWYNVQSSPGRSNGAYYYNQTGKEIMLAIRARGSASAGSETTMILEVAGFDVVRVGGICPWYHTIVFLLPYVTGNPSNFAETSYRTYTPNAGVTIDAWWECRPGPYQGVSF